MVTRCRLSSAIFDEIIHRVARVTRPEPIILFGSAARRDVGPNGDVELLVVKRGDHDRSRPLGDPYLMVRGADRPVDVTLVQPEEGECCGQTPTLVIDLPIGEGKEVSPAPTVPA